MNENRQIRRLGIGIVVLFVLLFVQLNYLQVVRSDSLSNDPRNNRKVVRDFSRPRGAIVSADGTVLARSVETDDSFRRRREYPAATAQLFSHVTGYFSFTFGTEGVERTYNDELAGRADALELDDLGDVLLGRTRTANVVLTIPVALQRLAADGLRGRKGSVVALDPRTGAVLAMYSNPTFDPNPLSGRDQEAVQAAMRPLQADPGRPLLPRTYRERFFPGSTFKVVTAASALASGRYTPDQPRFPVLRELELPQTDRPLRNFGGASCGGSLADSLRVSCNTAFAQLGLDLGAEQLKTTADAFGFDGRPPLDLPAAASSAFPGPDAFARDLPALAQSAIGQRDVAATPLQMALVAAAIANGGAVPAPHVVGEVRDDEGEVIRRPGGGEWRRAVDPAVAGAVRDMMVGVVQAGTARSASLPGIAVAAKTGTAQLGTSPPSSHTWMIAFAPADAPRVAVAVVVEGQPGVSEVTGGRVAGPIVRAMLQAALELVRQ